MLWLLAPLLAMPLLWPIVRHFSYDDPFITYRYAANLRAGHGFVYNPGVRVLSTTTPLYTLLLASLSGLWGGLPLLSNIIGLLSLLAGASLLAVLLPEGTPRPLRGLAGLLLLLTPLPMHTLGSEMPLYTALILAVFWCLRRRSAVAAGLLSGLAAVTRADGLLVFLILLWNLGRDRDWRAFRRAAFVFCLPVVPWYLFARLYFGAWTPATLATKQAQYRLDGGYGFFRGLLTTLNFLRKDFGNLEFALMVVLIGAGLFALVRCRSFPPLLQWAALYIVAYILLRVRYYHWYYAPLFPVGVWILIVGLERLVSASARRFGTGERVAAARILAAALPVGLLALLIAQAGWVARNLAQKLPSPHDVAYREAGVWMARNTPAQASFGALEVGIMGYYSHRRVVDFAGLIEPDIAHAPGHAYLDWIAYGIQRYHPDYLLLTSSVLPVWRDHPDLRAQYRVVHIFTPAGFERIVVFQHTAAGMPM